ncbi:MAG: hypothetical protein GY757_17135, partial [bacterium]|nr:hypothetical protein [bacterium]
MNTISVSLNDLIATEGYRLSYPLQPQLYEEFKSKFYDFPFLIVNLKKEILFGLDYLEYLKSSGAQNTVALQMDLEGTDALFLNYSLKHKFTGLNLYEKLVFIKKTAACDKSVIYRDTELDIAIDKNLLQHI